jgi:hypothetical protein
LLALLAEWTRTDATYDEKVSHLTGGAGGGKNAPYLLDGTTLIDDNRTDDLRGGAGGLNLYVAQLVPPGRDRIRGLDSGEIVIAPGSPLP